MKKEIKYNNEETFSLQIDNFSGPLDLLLHLAKTNEIEITDISLNLLIDQYIIFIESTHKMGIDIASSYLEMAAELIRLKSLTLLPNLIDDESLLEELEDNIGLNREELIAKILEYKCYKEISINFANLIEKREHKITRPKERLTKYLQHPIRDNINTELIQKAMTIFLNKEQYEERESKTIETHEFSTEELINEFKVMSSSFYFEEKIKNQNKNYVITLFMALLESLKLNIVKIKYQEGLILIEKWSIDEQ